jgi:Zn-dependent protease
MVIRPQRSWGQRPSRAVRPSPIFLAFLAVAALGGYLAWISDSSTSAPARLFVFVFVLASWVVSICLHEFGHAYLAHRGGDRDVAAAGYLTLNPFRYANPLLSVVLPLVFIALGGIGLPGGAVYLHRHSMRSRAAQSLTAAAGPLVNVAFATVLLYFVQGHQSCAHLTFWSALAFLAELQVMAAVLNLLPIPGLDGYAIIEPYLDPATARGFEKIKPWGMLGVFVLLQVQQVNTAFFTLINRIYSISGASEFFYAQGYALFKFWQN